MNSLSIKEIMEILPHRYPFLLIDRVQSWIENESIIAIKNVSINEPFFQGHFPTHPIMPGVMMIEALAQAAGVLAYLSDRKSYQDYVYYLAAVEKAKFRKPVVPGDRLQLYVHFETRKERFDKVAGRIFVADTLVCEAHMISAKEKV
ncbi:MAG: 3-hydroxyacyl-ACP dehydratase FabZ [Gammaproteobacteria bacterium]|nr:3-hydroxyacyl-ACP dehydratase FabZ [Gammaproteobacteria bacterium]